MPLLTEIGYKLSASGPGSAQLSQLEHQNIYTNRYILLIFILSSVKLPVVHDHASPYHGFPSQLYSAQVDVPMAMRMLILEFQKVVATFVAVIITISIIKEAK